MVGLGKLSAGFLGIGAMSLEVADFSELDVLLVEDNQFIRLLLREMLLAFGVRNVREVSDGTQALWQIQRRPPDLVITDWVMAPGDGLSLLRKLRSGARGGTPRIPVIVLSGHATDDYVALALGEGADSYIVKPFNAATLMTHIMKVAKEDKGVTYLA